MAKTNSYILGVQVPLVNGQHIPLQNKANLFRLVYVDGATLTKLTSSKKIFATQVHLFSFIYCKLRIKISLKDYVEHYGLVKKKKRITQRKHV